MNYIDQLKIKGILYTLKDPTVADLINARIQELIGTAPANLDTLQELAAAISSGDEAVEGILTTLATKTSKEYVDNLFANIQLTPGPLGETGPLGPKGDTGTFDYSDLADYVTNTALGTKIGNLGTTVPVYSFESYSANGAVKYGEGTVKPTGKTGVDVAEVIVVTNTSTDPNAAEFVGQKFWIADDATIGDTLYQLLDAEGQEVGIAVKITAIDVRDLTVKEYVDALDLKKANIGDSYTKQLSDAKYLTTHQDISGKVNTTSVGAANGVASLNAEGKVPASQLPSYVDDVIEGYLVGGKFYKGLVSDNPDHECVDLDLPSGTRWATVNIGASDITDYGNYYQYGKGSAQYSETSGDADYDGPEGTLSASLDTATQVWGEYWHTPTKDLFDELIANTDLTWETIDGVNGGKFASKSDPTKYIFIPAAGFYNNNSISNNDTTAFVGTSTSPGSSVVYGLYLDSSNHFMNYMSRSYGLSIRPVNNITFPDEGIDEITSESDKIYVDKDSNKTYRWGGSAYVEVSPSVVVGTNTGNAADGKVVDDHIKDTTSHITAAERTAWNAKVDTSLIGNLGNASEAVPATYYTAEEAATYNTENSLLEGDEGYKSEGDVKTEAVDAVPYTTVMEVILDKYQALLARIETLENA